MQRADPAIHTTRPETISNDKIPERVLIDRDTVEFMMLICDQVVRQTKAHDDDDELLRLCVDATKRLLGYER